jgi:hypothetical protein
MVNLPPSQKISCHGMGCTVRFLDDPPAQALRVRLLSIGADEPPIYFPLPAFDSFSIYFDARPSLRLRRFAYLAIAQRRPVLISLKHPPDMWMMLRGIITDAGAMTGRISPLACCSFQFRQTAEPVHFYMEGK